MTRLSDSKHPAYHLRPNKAVDRFIFLELLRSLVLYNSDLPHTYVGLGGPFLEDFRLLSHEFPGMELVCVEIDSETLKRQEFHVCSSNMTFVPGELGEYIANSFPSERSVAVWADYTNMSRECLGEIADISRKAVPGSLLRVTVCAETPIFRKLGISASKFPSKIPDKKREVFEKLRNSYRRDMAVDGFVFRNEWFEWANFSREEFPRMLARMIGTVAQGACTESKVFLPLHTVKYSDGTIMLSISGLICHEDERSVLTRHFQQHFAYFTNDIDEVDVIDMPSLTTKERLCLDEILPTEKADGEACIEKLGYLIEGDGKGRASRRKMEQYEKYYRLYPYFGKVVP